MKKRAHPCPVLMIQYEHEVEAGPQRRKKFPMDTRVVFIEG